MSSDSWRRHSTSSASLRPGQAGSPMPSRGPLSARGHELAPGGDDARGVAAEALHVGEAHAVGVGAERSAQQLDLVVADGHEDRAVQVDRRAQVGQQAGEVLLVARVEDRLVMEAAHAQPHQVARPPHRVRHTRERHSTFKENPRAVVVDEAGAGQVEDLVAVCEREHPLERVAGEVVDLTFEEEAVAGRVDTERHRLVDHGVDRAEVAQHLRGEPALVVAAQRRQRPLGHEAVGDALPAAVARGIDRQLGDVGGDPQAAEPLGERRVGGRRVDLQQAVGIGRAAQLAEGAQRERLDAQVIGEMKPVGGADVEQLLAEPRAVCEVLGGGADELGVVGIGPAGVAVQAKPGGRGDEAVLAHRPRGYCRRGAQILRDPAGLPRLARGAPRRRAASCSSASTRRAAGGPASPGRSRSTRRSASAGSTASAAGSTTRATRSASRRGAPAASGARSTSSAPAS